MSAASEKEPCAPQPDKDADGDPRAADTVRPMPSWKRTMDLLGAALGLLIFWPLFLAIAISIKANSKGPVFFRQERVGLQGRRFIMWKFRSQREGAGDSLHRQHVEAIIRRSSDPDSKPEDNLWREIEDDPRVTSVGRILRKTSLDELPQLYNVLRNEMSLVGPRPAIQYEVDVYLPWHRERLSVKPGITGLWQVTGRSTGTFEEMVHTDIRYAREFSFALDVRILVKTVSALLTHLLDRASRTG